MSVRECVSGTEVLEIAAQARWSKTSKELAVLDNAELKLKEEKLAELGLPYSYFRPQYIYGPVQGKSCKPTRSELATAQMPRWRGSRAMLSAVSHRHTFGSRHVDLAFFFDRLTRGRPVPVPGDGTQAVTMTHAADNAQMICNAIGPRAHHPT